MTDLEVVASQTSLAKTHAIHEIDLHSQHLEAVASQTSLAKTHEIDLQSHHEEVMVVGLLGLLG